MSQSHKRAFTLIELLVVIAIIALLSSVVLASVNSARHRAITAAANSTVRQYIIALNEYYTDNNSYPVTTLNQYSCLGVGICESRGITYWTNNALNAALDPYIKGNPSVNDNFITLSLADSNSNTNTDIDQTLHSQFAMPMPIYNDYKGALYKCTNITSSGSCNDVIITWAVFGAGGNICGPGTVTLTNNIDSECTVELKVQ